MEQVVNLINNDRCKLIVVIRIMGDTIMLRDLEMNDRKG